MDFDWVMCFRSGLFGIVFVCKVVCDCDVLVVSYEELVGFGLEDLVGKILVIFVVFDD